LNHKLKIEPEIYQELIDFYGTLFNLPPLSAKIYAFLIFDFEKKGFAFDDLVETFCASKSSVSFSIKFLLSNNLIKTINKIDERKRYFIINNDFVKIRFEEIANRMKQEIKILDQLNKFKEKQLVNENLSERYYIYKSLLENNIENIEETLKKL
jgi:DNA-binding transcriptional regulator GbsR (MarR family)